MNNLVYTAPGTTVVSVSLNIIEQIPTVELAYAVEIDVVPPTIIFAPVTIGSTTRLHVRPLQVPLASGLTNTILSLLSGKVDSFYDEERQLKTILNFGHDYQSVLTNWKGADRGDSLYVKLLNPLPPQVTTKTQVYIDREVSSPLIDSAFIYMTPNPAPKVYLRPRNESISVVGKTGISITKATLGNLLSSGTFDPVRPSDPVVEQWYTNDVNTAQLNIDYSNYNNFVFFGSAKQRLDAFINKIGTIQKIDDIIANQSSSVSLTSIAVTQSVAYSAIQRYATERLDIIRSFDSYESFLYFKSNVPFSGSFSGDASDPTYYIPDTTYPKIGTTPLRVADIAPWYAVQSKIALDYDANNNNSLVNNLPAYLQNDTNSREFLAFVSMVGHQFDTMKSYVDHMSTIHNRSSDPAVGISPDLVWNLGQSLGIELPNQYALKKIVDYTVGSSANSKIYREIAAETWKRIIHNHIYMMKSKGTKASLQALVNSYGLLPNVLQIKESITPGVSHTENSYEEFDEQTNSLVFNGSSSITIPWSVEKPQAVQMRFATTVPSHSVLFSIDTSCSLQVIPTTTQLGVLALSCSGSMIISEAMPFFNGEYYNVMVRPSITPTKLELVVKQAVGNTITRESTTTAINTTLFSAFSTGSHLYLGGSATDTHFNGLLDEFRIWAETPTDDVFDLQVKYPGLYAGNTPQSAANALLVRLSFNTPHPIGILGTIPNETPYLVNNPNSVLATFPVSNFPTNAQFPYNYSVSTRTVLRFAPNAGGIQFTTNKVIVADPPTLQYVGSTNVPVLFRDKSIVSTQKKAERRTVSNRIGFYFSLTEAINDSMMRAIGTIDLQNLIGDPKDVDRDTYAALQELDTLYWSVYSYKYNVNAFIKFVEGLLEPLFTQAKALIPAKAKLLSGIVHEPHILERNKVPRRGVQVAAGSLTKYHHENPNLDTKIVLHDPKTVTAGYMAMTSSLNIAQDKTLIGVSNTLNAVLEVTDATGNIYASTGILNGLVHTHKTTFVTAKNIIIDGSTITRAYRNYLLSIYDDGSLSHQALINKLMLLYNPPYYINVKNVMTSSSVSMGTVSTPAVTYAIKPITDFDNLSGTTYFMSPFGAYPTTKIVKSRANTTVLTAKGVWASNTTYQKNDYVSFTAGSSTVDKSYEYVCVNSIASSISPVNDTSNWKRMLYIPTEVVDIKKATIIGTSVNLVPLSTPGTIIVGYASTHFKFTRDNRRGTLNHQFLGCLQTDNTTTNGLPVVQVTKSDSDRLVVTDGTAPIQATSKNSGPILDVV